MASQGLPTGRKPETGALQLEMTDHPIRLGTNMSSDNTRRVMSAYFDALGAGRVAKHFTEDVTWITVTDGNHVTGPQP